MKKQYERYIYNIRLIIIRFFCGQRAAQRKKFAKEEWLFYASTSIEERLDLSHKRFLKTSKGILLLTSVLILVGIAFSITGESLEDRLMRETYGGETKEVALTVDAIYGDDSVHQRVEISVLPQTLTLAEEQARLSQCVAFLTKNILGKNIGFMKITGDLELVEYDSENDVSIAWESSNPEYVNAQGDVNFLPLKHRERVTLHAHLSIGSSEKQHSFTLYVDPLSKTDFTDNISRNVALLVDRLSKDSDGKNLRLPRINEEGLLLNWSPVERSSPLILIPISCFLIGLLYFSGNNLLKKSAKQRKSEIEEELPNLALQLILLLNAGLVVNAAFKEILLQNKESNHPLYQILEKLFSQCLQSNESFVKSFYSFSQRSGNRNLIRFMTLVSDHEIRGSELAEKLQRERDILWESRLQRAKGKAKEVETKLCLPLMLLLLVLVVISVSPALLEL